MAQIPRHPPAGLPVLDVWGAKDPSATPEVLSGMREMIAGFGEIEFPEKDHG
jgi:hypothetical protein